MIIEVLRLVKPVLTRRRWCRSAATKLGVVAALAAGCGSTPEPSLRVGDVRVPLSAIGSIAHTEQQILFDLVAFGAAIVHDEADALGTPLVREIASRARIADLPFALAFERLGYDRTVLRAAYLDRPEWELSVRHIVLLVGANAPVARRDSIRVRAGEIAALARRGDDFAALAALYSEEPGAAERGGLLQPGRQGSWVDPFWNAAAALQPGQTSGVVESIYGFHVLHLEDRTPVPFEEASRSALLRWIVRSHEAAEAMEDWMGAGGRVEVDVEAARTARGHIAEGDALPPDLVLATGTAGTAYRGSDLAVGWAILPPGERTLLEQDEPAFLDWVDTDARQSIWAAHAERLEVEIAPEAYGIARTEWLTRVVRWSSAFGFRPELRDDRIVPVAMQAMLSGAPEARAARAELRSLRPLLREFYPVVVPAP